MAEPAKKQPDSPCCLSHLFFTQASTNPAQVAVVHAGAAAGDRYSGNVQSSNEFVAPSYPRVYPGDECFTYGEVLSAVNSLSHKLHRVLDGFGDPDLISPKGYFSGKFTVNSQIQESHFGATSIEQQLTGYPDTSAPSVIETADHNVHLPTEMHGVPSLANVPKISGIHIAPSVQYIVAVLAVVRCGEAFLPLDPSWPNERILSILLSLKVGLIIKCKSSIGTSDTDSINGDDWLIDHGISILYISMERNRKEKFRSCNLVWPCESRNPRTFCYLIYTSGSTGKPKAVCGTEKGLLNRFLWMQTLFPLQGDVLLFKTSVGFIDHLQEFLSAVLTCTPVIVPSFHVLKENPLYLVNILKAYYVSRLTAVPSLMRGIISVLQSQEQMQIKEALQVLVLSGEVLPISLWENLHKLLPDTCILNFYGSTEVSGDCMYFDCKNMSAILETEVLTSVPIGTPMSNCDIMLVGQTDEPDEGEIHVGGSCLCAGYLFYNDMLSSNYIYPLEDNGTFYGLNKSAGSHLYFKTGDFARRLHTGDLVFLGRKDRLIKINGQRMALEEIENAIREHPNVVDAAVTLCKREEFGYLQSYLVLKKKDDQADHCDEKLVRNNLSLCMRKWLSKRLPQAMIPSHYVCMESFPLSSSGKVDYALLTRSTVAAKRAGNEIDSYPCDSDLLQTIKQAFCDALMVEEVADSDDFFFMGGNSITAALIAHKLRIDMRLLYIFSSPCQLLKALLDVKGSDENVLQFGPIHERSLEVRNVMLHSDAMSDGFYGNKSHRKSMQLDFGDQMCNFTQKVDKPQGRPLFATHAGSPCLESPQKDSSVYTPTNAAAWLSCFPLPRDVSYSRFNKVMNLREPEANLLHQACFSMEVPGNKNGVLHQSWKVHLRSCVDASPLVVFKGGDVFLFIGSHAHLFLCINAMSGLILWEVKLEGRVESSAAITGDFSQVVFGCFKGNIYFLDFTSGSISWVFQTGGEVKSQPVVDKSRSLIWCGSHDHSLYALDYRNHCCVYAISCGGSIYGSPSLDLVHNNLYVASTSGRVTAVSVEAIPFSVAWVSELGAPIFGSLSIDSVNGRVICCLVDGHVIALDSGGSIIWKAITGGPIFAGPCISSSLPSQVLICCRNGSVYSFELAGGDLLWEYQIRDPITSSAYVDENTQLISDPSLPVDRLACVCSCSGAIHVLRVKQIHTKERRKPVETQKVQFAQNFACIDLPGDIFSSPVMIGGRIFVGCRDDYVHCIDLDC